MMVDVGRCSALLAVLAIVSSGCDERVPVRPTVTVRATHPDGVPLHPFEHATQMSGRLPDGEVVEVVRWGAGRRWLKVSADDDTEGWISASYLTEPPTVLGDVWRSGTACAGTEPPEREAGRARIASWNLHWFPDGSSRGPQDKATDESWMACAISSLGVDVIAVQEVLLHDQGRRALDRMMVRLNERTGGSWESHLDGCPNDRRQHVGFLVDTSRVSVERVRQLDDVNPLGACTGRLRPGLAADLRFVDGLELALVTVHLDSGTGSRDRAHRTQSIDRLAAGAAGLGRDEVLVVGDFNTMGDDETEADEELAALDARFAAAGLARIEGEVPCTEIYRRRGSLLDHAIATAGLRTAARLEVDGPCAPLGCRVPRGAHPSALSRLSDHCPLIVDLPSSAP